LKESEAGYGPLNVRDHGAVIGSTDFRLEEEQPRPGTVVVSVHGDLDLHSADALGDRLVGVAEQGASVVIVDLSDVEFVDSQGLGALLRGTRRLGGDSRRFRLVVPEPHVRRVFEITSLDRFFGLDETREQALDRGARAAAGEDVSDAPQGGMTAR
jgi:anti-sigma B factor antagonist